MTAPFGLIVRQGSAIRLTAVDALAEDLGLVPGLTLAAARARVPELQVDDADPSADAAFLSRLAEACRRYTPTLSLNPPDAVNLEIGGAAHLFGGEEALIDDVRARFGGLGLSVRVGAAANPAAAFAFARFETSPGSGSQEARLSGLPILALRLAPESASVLHGLGLRRIEQVEGLSRASVGLRLGPETLDRLDKVFERSAEALPFMEEAPPFMTQARIPDPICDEAQVMALCLHLARALSEALQTKGLGGRRFGLELFRVDGAVKRLEVQASRGLIDPLRITGLFAERLGALNEGLEADFGFDAARLWATRTQRIRPETAQLLTDRGDEGDFIGFLDRVRARFGLKVVQRFEPSPESRLPETAVRAASLSKAGSSCVWANEEAPVFEGAPLRPLTLFRPPQPITAIAGVPEDPPVHFTWRRVQRRIVRAEGPERIAQEWWRAPEPEALSGESAEKAEPRSPHPQAGLIEGSSLQASALPGPRDYYRLEDVEGRRYWVFREGMHAPAAPPRWFLHGLFA